MIPVDRVRWGSTLYWGTLRTISVLMPPKRDKSECAPFNLNGVTDFNFMPEYKLS